MSPSKKQKPEAAVQRELHPLKLKGIIGSPGHCCAKVYVFRRHLEIPRVSIDESMIPGEIERLEAAVAMTHRSIATIQKTALDKHGEKYAAIFDSHLLMLSDPMFIPQIIKQLKKEKLNVEALVREFLEKMNSQFSLIEDKYLRERAIDMQDVGDKLLRNLLGIEGPAKAIGNHPYVLVAEDVTPSELLEFARNELKGVCLDSGGATSHVAILAGALEIPSVFGLHNLTKGTHTGDTLLVDTRQEGLVILHPDEKMVAEFGKTISLVAEKEKVLRKPATEEGYEPLIGVNIGRVEELPALAKFKVKRIGLFRSEFLFMEGVDLPSESFQESVYREVIRSAGEMAVLRTIDIGSDKPVRYFPFPREANPSMGFRSVRFAISRPDVFIPQLRAMVRASSEGPTRIIFPMVSVPDELVSLENIWNKVLDEVSPSKAPEWGIMVEVPSAIFMMDRIAKFTKYISLGTNDLMQFFYAVDRNNERLSDLAHALLIPFLRLIFYAVAAAKGEGIKIGICGEMAGDPAGFISLLGIGLDEFSMRPSSVPIIKKLIPQLNKKDVTLFVHEMLSSETHVDFRKELDRNFPNLISK